MKSKTIKTVKLNTGIVIEHKLHEGKVNVIITQTPKFKHFVCNI